MGTHWFSSLANDPPLELERGPQGLADWSREIPSDDRLSREAWARLTQLAAAAALLEVVDEIRDQFAP